MSWLNYLNPLNWPSDLSSTFVSQLENGILYLFALVLDGLLTLTGAFMSTIIGIIEITVGGIISAAADLGPLGLPIFVLGIVGILGFTALAFKAAKDMPVVGAFV